MEAGSLRPSQIFAQRTLHQPPPLAKGSDVSAFVDWACASTAVERGDVRAAMAAVSANDSVVHGLIDAFEAALQEDFSRALIILALVAESRSALGELYLADFIRRPLPTEGTIIDGQIAERVSMEMLQGKAVQGLAYLRTTSGDATVLDVIASHASSAVRGHAIDAYLWNHGDTPKVRAQLAALVAPADQRFVDRVRKVRGESAAAFDAKLAAYLEKYPDAIAEPPTQALDAAKKPKGHTPVQVPAPPTF